LPFSPTKEYFQSNKNSILSVNLLFIPIKKIYLSYKSGMQKYCLVEHFAIYLDKIVIKSQSFFSSHTDLPVLDGLLNLSIVKIYVTKWNETKELNMYFVFVTLVLPNPSILC
jgi:hypothetical protein